jgi:nucleotidyltransferase/DNA polymerase involved in DNA repair
VKKDPARVALVFVVPQGKMANYKRQEIIPEVADGTVRSVRGIGRQTETRLKELNISTIAELKEAIHKTFSRPR